MTIRVRPTRLAAALVLALGLNGCGPGTAAVAGKVTYQGKPVVWGSVSLQAADGSMHQIGLNADGTFRLDAVPVGPARVGVSSPDPKPSPRAIAAGETAGPQLPPGAWFPLPAKFADPSTSGLTLRVGGGPGDIDLK